MKEEVTDKKAITDSGTMLPASGLTHLGVELTSASKYRCLDLFCINEFTP